MRRIEDIGALAQRVEGLASSEFRRSLMSAMSDRVHKLIINGFVQQRDPTGKAWAARTSGGDWPILDTRREDGAVNKLTARPSVDGVTVRTNAYMQHHLKGRNARKWIPTEPSDLNPIWRPALMAVYANKLMERIKAGG